MNRLKANYIVFKVVNLVNIHINKKLLPHNKSISINRNFIDELTIKSINYVKLRIGN